MKDKLRIDEPIGREILKRISVSKFKKILQFAFENIQLSEEEIKKINDEMNSALDEMHKIQRGDDQE